MAKKMRVVVVHTLEQAANALAAADDLKLPLTLQSAPDAVLYAGPLYLKHMFEAAQKLYPRAKAQFILDCESAQAEAIAAMEAGHGVLRIGKNPKLSAIAKGAGVTVVDAPYEALDLQHVRNTKDACKKWLKEIV